MADEALKMVVFGAHPDDCEILAGGVAALYNTLGHRVWLVSLTNGDAGHNVMSGEPLAWRRKEEAARAAAVLGAQSVVLDNHDGQLLPSLEVRAQVITLLRQIRPDLVMTHRPYDYHPDHRYTGQVVQDALQMARIRSVVPSEPPLDYRPVAVYTFDEFQKPYPFIPDVVVDIDAEITRKSDALECHASQVYEFIFGTPPAGLDATQRRAWLAKVAEPELTSTARICRQKLIEKYGAGRGAKVHYAEAFEACEYGSPLTEEAKKRLFPF
jgi:LmbE family N-acetylglucosaminyl deacetylase